MSKSLSMADMPYHFGVKSTIHLTKKQKEIIKINSKANIEYYNALIDINNEIFNLKRINLNHYKHPDYNNFVEWLMKNKNINKEFAIFLIEHHYVSQKTINQSKLKHVYQTPETTGSYFFDNKIKWLKQLKKSGKTLGNIHRFFYNKKIDSCCLSNANNNYKSAWNMYRKVYHSGTPAKKQFGNFEKYQTNNHYAYKNKSNCNLMNGNIRFIDKHHIKLPKLGVVYVERIRDIIWKNRNGIRIGTVTLMKDETNIYSISLQLGAEKRFVKPFKKTNKQLGIDLNISNFLVSNQGMIVENPNFYKKHLKRLKKQQKILSRKQQNAEKNNKKLSDSKNFQKQRIKVARINKRIFNQRNTFLDNLSKQLLKDYDFIVSEDMKSKNMMKNYALSQSIWDVGWRMFINKLDYKANLYEKVFITVDSYNTTQMCSNCGYVCGSDERHKKLNPHVREWQCPNCGTHHNRDLNAAINVLKLGIEENNKK